MIRNLRAALPALICVSVLTLSSCGKQKATDTEMKVDTGEAMGVEEPLESAVTGGIMEGRTSGPMLPVYFDFDSSDVRGDQVSRIQVNSDFLKNNPGVKIRIEGNCDARGTNEYNMALGERRALSSKKYLMNLGVSESRMTTVSYGEERILLHGHDELSWAQNRRDDFVIQE